MSKWLDFVLFVVVIALFVSHGLSVRAGRRKTKDTWQAFATIHGWQLLPNTRRTTMRIGGTQANRNVEASAYVSDSARNGITEYVDITVEMSNPTDFVLQAGLWEPLLRNKRAQQRLRRKRVKSGEPIFDSGYHIQGYPEDAVHQMLAAQDVQLTIRAIYPLDAPLFYHPMMQIEGNRLALRFYRPYYNTTQLQKLIEQTCMLACTIEAAFDHQASKGKV